MGLVSYLSEKTDDLDQKLGQIGYGALEIVTDFTKRVMGATPKVAKGLVDSPQKVLDFGTTLGIYTVMFSAYLAEMAKYDVVQDGGNGAEMFDTVFHRHVPAAVITNIVFPISIGVFNEIYDNVRSKRIAGQVLSGIVQIVLLAYHLDKGTPNLEYSFPPAAALSAALTDRFVRGSHESLPENDAA